ncbi:hypothetical protein BC830DRAFT_265140 [Chytriomyces sp. MP71]|nr:hypothetical protein BC830DRAFT_265140 [Chytriomyces sp. MP71]
MWTTFGDILATKLETILPLGQPTTCLLHPFPSVTSAPSKGHPNSSIREMVRQKQQRKYLQTRPSTPAKSTPNRAAEWRKARIGKLQQFRKARQEAPDPEMLEPPAEKDYETRPMSAHTRFLLSDYIKPSGMVVEGEEPDDFEKRMRTLFLPSLFAGDAPDDFKNNSAKGRRFPTLSRGGTSNRSAASGRGQSPQATPKGETGTSRRTVSFKEAANSGDDSGKEGAIQEVKVDHRRQSQAKPPLNVTKTPPRPSSANRRPDSSDMRRRLFMPPPPTKRPTSATSASSLRTRLSFQVASTQLVNNNVSGGIAPNSSDNLPQIRRTPSARSRSAKLRQRRLSTNFHKHVPIKQAQLQTMSAGADENPSDLHLPLLRWEVAIYGVLQHIKLKQALSEDRVRTPGSASVEMMQRAKRDKMDVIGALRVKRIYDIFVGSREDKDLDVLDSILGKYLCFAKLSPVVRYKLYNCCTLETHPRGTVVIREGFQARFWYVLLTGECLHQLRPDTPMTVTTRVGVGGSVGEFNNLYGSGSTNETRHVRATCLMRCDFLRIEKSDYLAISREAKGLDTMVFEFFSTVPAFFGVERQVLNSLCQRSIVRKFDADQVVLRAGEPCANVYFIIKGKIRALHMVTFVKIDAGYLRDTKIDRRHKYTLTPQTLTSRLGPSDEVVRELATVLDLTQGMSFPPMKMSRVIQEQMEADSGRRGSLGIVLPPGRMDPHSNPCPFHFVVVDRLEVVAVGMRDLVDILPPETLRRVMEQRSLTDVSSQEIEERFLAAQGWRNSGLDGNMSLRIMDTGFINNSSWSNPVVKGKFKKLAQEEEEREALMTATTTQAE